MKLNGTFFAMIVLLGVQMMHAGPFNSPAHSPQRSRRSAAAAAHAQQRATAATASAAQQDAPAVEDGDDPASNDYGQCPFPVRVVFGVASVGCVTYAACLQWCLMNGGCE